MVHLNTWDKTCLLIKTAPLLSVAKQIGSLATWEHVGDALSSTEESQSHLKHCISVIHCTNFLFWPTRAWWVSVTVTSLSHRKKRETEKGTVVVGSNWSFLLSDYAKWKQMFIESVDQWFLSFWRKKLTEDIKISTLMEKVILKRAAYLHFVINKRFKLVLISPFGLPLVRVSVSH